MGWKLLNQPDSQTNPNSAEISAASSGSLEQKIFYPLTFPVTVGPGCIVVMLTLSAHASVKQNVVSNVMAHAAILLALIALSATSFYATATLPKSRSEFQLRPRTASCAS